MSVKHLVGILLIALLFLVAALVGSPLTATATGGEAHVSSGAERSILFSPPLHLPVPGRDNTAVGVGDFNGDGLNDVALCNTGFAPLQLNLFFQTPAGGLTTPPVAYALEYGCYSMAVGDLNNDQRDDVVITASYRDWIMVFLQQSNGTLAPTQTFPVTVYIGSVTVADVNNDSRDDVVTSQQGELVIFYQQSNGTLAPATRYPLSPPDRSWTDIDTGDFNNDGRTDVVVSTTSGNNSSTDFAVILQSASGTMGASTSYNVGNMFAGGGTLAAGDVTGDGLSDVVLIDRFNPRLHVFAQNSSGGLTLNASYQTAQSPGPIEIADIDEDGRSDVVILHSGSWQPEMAVYRQRDDGTLGPMEVYRAASGQLAPQSLEVGDFNNDGTPDVAIAAMNNLVVVYGDPEISFLPIMLR